MVHRDPQTGKFVADEGTGIHNSEIDRYTRFTGTISYSIPAADLGGGVTNQDIDGDASQVIDFTNFLDSDEVFLADRIDYRGTAGLPTTATAESSMVAAYVLATDFVGIGSTDDLLPADPYGLSTEREDSIVNIRFNDENDESRLYTGSMYAESSVADTTNGLAAGAANADDNVTLEFPDRARPAWDRDDELTIPTALAIQNVSDHAVFVNHAVTLHGPVIEV